VRTIEGRSDAGRALSGATPRLVNAATRAEDAARRDAPLLAAAARVVCDRNTAVVRAIVHGYDGSYAVLGEAETTTPPDSVADAREPVRRRQAASAAPRRPAFLAQFWRTLRHDADGRAPSSSG
jgi:hypothetical protein